MRRGDQERLRDIKEAMAAIAEHLERARSALGGLDNPLLRDALLFQFVVIGEAVKHLSEEMRAQAPDIPWEAVAGLRDLIAHEYFRIEIERILAIVERDLPALEQAIDRLLSERGD